MADQNGLYLFPGEPKPRPLRLIEVIDAGYTEKDPLSISDEEWETWGVTRHDPPDFNPHVESMEWNGQEWTKADRTASELSAALSAAQLNARERVTEDMRQRLCKGVSIASAGGVVFRADDVGQGQIFRLRETLLKGGKQKIVTRSGTRMEVDEVSVQAIFEAVVGYVMDMVSAEFDNHEAIDALTEQSQCEAYVPSWPTWER